MQDPTALDFATIDLGGGESWLTTRLLLFALLLEELRGLRCLVFVHTAPGVGQEFLGLASPVSIRRALASTYPWLDAAVADAGRVGSVRARDMDQERGDLERGASRPSEPCGVRD
jgi:hypothetical protein